jgi:3-methyladenine DNA glycosylase AlkC
MYKEITSIVQSHYGINSNITKTIAPSTAWASASDLKYITREMIEKYKNILQENVNNKLQNNTTVHFSPLSNLPRYKYNNYIEENKLNIKKVRTKDKIDSLIISNTLINEYYFSNINDKKYYIVPTSLLKIKSHNSERITSYFVREDRVEEVKSVSPSLYQQLIKCSSFTGSVITGGWGSTQGYAFFEYFSTLLNNYGSLPYNIIFDESINKEINQGLVLDADTFDTLYNMLDSSNKDNWSLALEMIANCDIEASKPYVLYLIWNFDYLKKFNGNSNYKFCLKLLDKYRGIYHSHTVEKFISDIVKVNPEFKQDIFNCFKMHINAINKKNIIQEINVL